MLFSRLVAKSHTFLDIFSDIDEVSRRGWVDGPFSLLRTTTTACLTIHKGISMIFSHREPIYFPLVYTVDGLGVFFSRGRDGGCVLANANVGW